MRWLGIFVFEFHILLFEFGEKVFLDAKVLEKIVFKKNNYNRLDLDRYDIIFRA